MGDMKGYKRWADMSVQEKKMRRWNDDGQPRLVWDSKNRGTYRKPRSQKIMNRVPATNKSITQLKTA